MEIKEAIQVLKDHNVWRKGEDETAIMTDPKILGIAIDTVVNEFENLFISGVVKSCCDQTRDINKIMTLKFRTCRTCKKEIS